MRVAAGQTLRVPGAEAGFNLVTQEPKGATKFLIIASATPLGNALKALQGVASRGGQYRGPVTLRDPTEVVGNLLDDLGTKSRGSRGIASSNSRTRNVDTSQLAALSITFEVV